MLAVVLGLAAGLLGMFAFAALSGRAGAAATVTQQAEVTLMTDLGSGWQGTPGEAYRETYAMAAIDTTGFPAGTTFTLNVSGYDLDGSSHCFRLGEWISDHDFTPVSGSEICTSPPPNYFAIESGPLTLSAGEHIYRWEWKQATGGLPATLGSVRIVAEWQEYSPPVGGIALLPDIGDSSASNYIALAVLAGLALVAVTAGARYARRRWLG